MGCVSEHHLWAWGTRGAFTRLSLSLSLSFDHLRARVRVRAAGPRVQCAHITHRACVYLSVSALRPLLPQRHTSGLLPLIRGFEVQPQRAASKLPGAAHESARGSLCEGNTNGVRRRRRHTVIYWTCYCCCYYCS